MKLRVQFDNPRVVDAAGFWLERWRGNGRRWQCQKKKYSKRSRTPASLRCLHSN
jgi:hypothetical protein